MKAFCPGGASAPFPAREQGGDTAGLRSDAGRGQHARLRCRARGGRTPRHARTGDEFSCASSATNPAAKCVPCRVGSQKAVEILDGVMAGQAGDEAFSVFPELDEALRLTSICGLGHVVLNPATSVLEHFPEDVARHTAGA